jgi:HAE1 family hydrophobic/amphiphilic exporter-1
VPVSLIGTFVLFPLFGFSINTLSLFGLVLAIGLVVDDAIVVVEAVERHIEEGMSPREATLQAMREVSARSSASRSCFRPSSFRRRFFRYHRTVVSTVRPHDCDLRHLLRVQRAFAESGAFIVVAAAAKENARPARLVFDRFNRVFGSATHGYVNWSRLAIRKAVLSFALLAVLAVGAGLFGSRLPSGFLPEEDQGYVYLALQLPDASSLERTDQAARKIEDILSKIPGVQYTTSVIGFSLLSLVQNTYSAFFFVTFKPWSERTKPEEQYAAIKANINKQLAGLTEGIAFAFPPPAIPGVGTSGGFQFILEDRAGKDVAFLAQNLKTFLDAARKRPELGTLIPTFLPNVPQVFVDVDRDKVIKQGIDLGQVYQTLQTFMGGFFVNYFNRFGRTWQVYIEAEGDYRTDAKNVGQFFVRNANGDPVPLDAISTIKNIAGPEFTLRYNEYRSAQINGSAAPGYSSNQAMNALEEVFAKPCLTRWATIISVCRFRKRKRSKASPRRRVRNVAHFRVPDSRCALRKLVAAIQCAARHTGRSVRRVCDALAARNAKQYLRANRSDHAHRPGSEERDPHRRIRQGRIRKRQTAARRRARRRALASASDPDDFLCFHLRNAAACGSPAAPAPSPAVSSAQP